MVIEDTFLSSGFMFVLISSSSSFRFLEDALKERCVRETRIRVLTQLDHASPSDGMTFPPFPDTATICANCNFWFSCTATVLRLLERECRTNRKRVTSAYGFLEK